MEKIEKFDDVNSANLHDEEEVTTQNFVLRIWKTGKNTFRGYLLDPLTNVRYTLPTSPLQSASEDEGSQAFQGVLIESLGCWIGLWQEEE